MNRLLASLGVLALCALSSSANAISISSWSQDTTVYPTTTLGYQAPASFTGTVDNPTGSSSGAYRSPWQNLDETWINPEHQTLDYTSVRNGNAWYALTGDSLGIFWGSPDSYNTITFWTGWDSANKIGTGDSVSFTGNQLGITLGYGHTLAIFNLDQTFNAVQLYSGQPAFEFANMVACTGSCTESQTGVVPLPAALPLFASGLGVMGLLGWRRKRKKAAATAA